MKDSVTITKIIGREILDSRGNPTVEAEVYLSDGTVGRAAVPSGASTGLFEAKELRDKDNARYKGKGVLKAVDNINTKIDKHLAGMNPYNIFEIDKKLLQLDGTKDKSNLRPLQRNLNLVQIHLHRQLLLKAFFLQEFP